jgi:hypothetical protein
MARRPHHVFEYDSIPTHSQPGREFLLANIDCTLYLDRGTRADAAQRLRAAFGRLAKRNY